MWADTFSFHVWLPILWILMDKRYKTILKTQQKMLIIYNEEGKTSLIRLFLKISIKIKSYIWTEIWRWKKFCEQTCWEECHQMFWIHLNYYLISKFLLNFTLIIAILFNHIKKKIKYIYFISYIITIMNLY